MRAAVVHATGDIEIDEVADPVVREPTDAVVRVHASGICGTDLWLYRGDQQVEPGRRAGHEFVGEIIDAGPEVRTVAVGDFVIAPFRWSDGTCPYCLAGLHSSCPNGGVWGTGGVDGGQGEAVRVPFADGTLVRVPPPVHDSMLPKLLALSDVLATGRHAARCARVEHGSVAAVIGDGAVGLCAVLAAKSLGAQQVIALSHHTERAEIASRFGATDIVSERGEEAVARVLELTGGLGASAVLECVGGAQTWQTAIDIARDGATIGYVGKPVGIDGLPLTTLYSRNIGVAGGLSPARAYLPELLDDVLAGRIDPSPIFDTEVVLDDVARGYAAMADRKSIKVMVRP
ncbi:zinc-binding dehydrogenase [Nocardia iowensis]|uniref:Alcohol dehydrogenase catalytic domain-containing protein n=1 Tax=Nocardia iowensis TaxID=204891 RepID=A0ABX8S078_NOCIO|nr:alcohol dehydrogenase catalytic domain-containing protein [Nocardia iowensis]QXN94502.1 alcohol dehydrogenase catalytic domain-containing protein [Nocardia iowensis]